MKQKEFWKPSKFIETRNGHKASRNPDEVAISSRLIGDIQVKVYSKFLREHASGILLDLGCGKVPLYGIYKNFIDSNICIDWENSAHTNPYLDFVADLNTGIPLPNEHVDTLLATDVLEHVLKPDILWGEITRVLKPGGKLIIGVPFLYRLHEEPYDYYRYTEYRLRDWCTSNNFDILYLAPYGGSLEVLLDLVAKHLSFSTILSAIHLALSKAILSSPLGRIMYQMTAEKFPLGYGLVAQKRQNSLLTKSST